MTQAQLNHAVARATGETITTIRSMGFKLVPDEIDEPDDAEEDYLWLDCPFCRSPVLLTDHGAEELPEIAECLACNTLFDYQQDEVYQADLDEIGARQAKIQVQCSAA